MIVIARGGGSVEDLLPFSNETLVRAVAGCAHAGRERDRPRDRRAAARPGRRPRRVDTDRCRQADRAGPGRRAEPGRAICETGPERRCTAELERETEPWPGCPSGYAAPCAGYLARGPDADTRLRGIESAGRSPPGWPPPSPTSTTCAPGSARCRRRPHSTVATPSSARRGGRVVRDPAEALGALRIRVARGEFGAITDTA